MALIEAPTAPPAPACGACGAEIDRGQEYCLECGSRIVSRSGFLGGLTRVVEARLGRAPGDWLWVSLLALGVAAGGAAAAVALTGGGSGGGGRTIVATKTPPPATTATTTAGPAPTATAKLPTTPPPPEPTVLQSFPVDSGYTIVLASIPATRPGRVEARDKANEALDAGLTDVGFLRSDEYASLHPGYWVVFAGVYDSLEEAQSGTSRVTGRYPAAYPRQIAR